MTININWTDERKATYAKIAKTTGVVALAMFCGFWVGVGIMHLLTLMFGAKVAVIIYIVLYVFMVVWVFLTVFERDRYGFRK